MMEDETAAGGIATMSETVPEEGFDSTLKISNISFAIRVLHAPVAPVTVSPQGGQMFTLAIVFFPEIASPRETKR
jgi:hypothetical protein